MIWLLAAILFLTPDDPSLNEESRDVCPCQIRGQPIQIIVDQMLEMADGDGFAAPQIGIPKSIIVVNVAPGMFKEFINPHIVWQSEELTDWEESCPSVGPISALVPRSTKISVSAYDRHCRLSVQDFSGKTAQILQHAIDHLDGLLFPHRVPIEQHIPRVIQESGDGKEAP